MSESERGSSIVEVAIALTLLLAILFGIMEYGRVLYTYHAVANAARLGTRYAIVRGSACTMSGCPATSDSIQSYVRSQTPLVDANALAVAASWPSSGCNLPGCPVVVTVTYPYAILSPLLPQATLTMSSSSQMIISH